METKKTDDAFQWIFVEAKRNIPFIVNLLPKVLIVLLAYYAVQKINQLNTSGESKEKNAFLLFLKIFLFSIVIAVSLLLLETEFDFYALLTQSANTKAFKDVKSSLALLVALFTLITAIVLIKILAFTVTSLSIIAFLIFTPFLFGSIAIFLFLAAL